MVPSSSACRTSCTWSGRIAGHGGNCSHGVHSDMFLHCLCFFLGSSVPGRNCKYSGEPEYWVEVQETGEKGQEKETKKQRKETSKDHIRVEHCSNCCIFFGPLHNWLQVPIHTKLLHSAKISNPPASFHLFPWLRTMGPSLASVTLAGWLQWHAEQRLRMVLVQLRLLRRCLNTYWVIFQAITTMTNILTFGILPGQNEIYIYI